ncbi:hypothetical protein GCM10009676_04770 [Prauserella halophila]|uniref:Uncharacterized protein n=1 Tax=Prauserella halophila TaxID=185641 RepID=A0ABN1W229_9PSEU
MSDCWSIPGFEDVYLEDSWVLGIYSGQGRLTFDVDVVLRESHPDYRPPVAGEQYCYGRGRLCFASVTACEWVGGCVVPAIDASDEEDLGSFDRFEVHGDRYMIEGDFGRIEVVAGPPSLELMVR